MHRTTLPRLLLILGMVTVLFVGCQSARYVRQTQYDGVVAIPDNSSSWPFYHRKHADELMTKQFPEGYVVESEGEEVVGYDTDVEQYAQLPVAGPVKLSVAGTKTTARTEWRIHYRRR